MSQKLNYETKRVYGESFREVHICGTRPPEQRNPSGKIFLVIVGLIIAFFAAGYWWKSWDDEWREMSKRYGLVAGDRVLNFEHRGLRDPAQLHVLELTPATYDRMLNLIRPQEYRGKTRGWFWPPSDSPRWWKIPADAEVIHVQQGTYAFDHARRRVYVYYWSM